MDCQICIKKYTNFIRLKFSCEKCFENVCIQCIFTFLLNNILNPCCLFCKNHLSLDSLKYYMPVSKHKKLLKLEFEEKFKKEELLLSQTQFSINEYFINDNDNSNEEIFEILRNLNHQNEKKIFSFFECKKCNSSFEKLKLIDDSFFCSECKNFSCQYCFEIIEKNNVHICNSESVDKIKMIKKKFSNCPSCNSEIEKEEGGCDQMFCVMCKTTFSWNTKRIIGDEEIKHNPHFYEWKRENDNLKREILDNPNEGYFLLKCENELKDQKILLPKISKIFGFLNNIEINKSIFLLHFQRMFLSFLFDILLLNEQESDIRHYFRILFCLKKIKYNQWKKNIKFHFQSLKRNEKIKKIILNSLDSLYKIVLSDQSDDKIEDLCLNTTKNLDKILEKNYKNNLN
jgi:hypothetical protein